ncbi:MAG TPA: mandelate racemase/muconate lactonizing enzyme family protein [Bradyrhizobium sp.]|nr:mandelate racemase/muconate lactonizing enzyme family protein [Bradyrhizobium sp.]
MTSSFTIRSIEALCFRYPLATPVVTSFGEMRDRPAVFVRAEDSDGDTGWGEVWCNFPSMGAEHRTRLINEMLAPMLIARAVTQPSDIFEQLSAATSVQALQSGEPGPFAQCIAGIDIALWDLFAKRARTPLWRMLGGTTGRMRVYASGINPAGSLAQAEAAMRRGHRALKLKIGFDEAGDLANLRALRRLAGGGFLAADVNQGWSIAQALQRAPRLEEFELGWLEEPLRADRPWSEWRSLQKRLTTPLAGGENIAGRENFAAALEAGVLTVLQPDAAKWGGITGSLAVARDTLASKRHYCPHYLGGGIGLLASAHLLAGSGGGGLLEVDCNDNPLREEFCGTVAEIREGEIVLGEMPGLGVEPDLKGIEKYRTS